MADRGHLEWQPAPGSQPKPRPLVCASKEDQEADPGVAHVRAPVIGGQHHARLARVRVVVRKNAPRKRPRLVHPPLGHCVPLAGYGIEHHVRAVADGPLGVPRDQAALGLGNRALQALVRDGVGAGAPFQPPLGIPHPPALVERTDQVGRGVQLDRGLPWVTHAAPTARQRHAFICPRPRARGGRITAARLAGARLRRGPRGCAGAPGRHVAARTAASAAPRTGSRARARGTRSRAGGRR